MLLVLFRFRVQFRVWHAGNALISKTNSHRYPLIQGVSWSLENFIGGA